uniref:Uncharacterized protein n=1 Tax=Anguilla anguilla TaxID=7936 RepID=A0A0E9VJG7_ANGAN
MTSSSIRHTQEQWRIPKGWCTSDLKRRDDSG